jgi:hypothetical protein
MADINPVDNIIDIDIYIIFEKYYYLRDNPKK